MNISTFRRLLADIKKVGQNRIIIKNTKEALEIIKTNLVTRKDVKERWKEVAEIAPLKKRMKKDKKKRRGEGSRKGAKYSLVSKKELWMIRVRALRSYVKRLKNEGKIDNNTKKLLYKKIKGGEIKNKRGLVEFLSRYKGDLNG